MKQNDSQSLLFSAILHLKTIEDCENFFDDLCTIKEIEAMKQRFHAAVLLSKNKTYEQVIEETDISSATLSRVSKCLHHGKNGYKNIINKMNH